MIRNLKVLGLAFGALLALSAMMASAAVATPEFTASSYPAQVTGSNTKGSEVFTTEGGKVECNSHFVSHSLSAASSTLTVTPTYTNCEAFGFIEATVNTEGCTYLFHVTEHVHQNSPTTTTFWRLHTDVTCEAGKSIKITASTCKVEIKPQNGLTTVAVEPIESNVTVEPNVEGIAYTVTQDGFLCPFGGTGNKTDGKYTGHVSMSRVGGGSVSVSGS